MKGHGVKRVVQEKTNLGRAVDGLFLVEMGYLETVTTCIQDPFLRGSKHVKKKMSL